MKRRLVVEQATTGCLITASMADTFLQRLVGLLGTRTSDRGTALAFPRCSSLHTWGMAYPLDIAFVDTESHVVASFKAVKPWCIRSAARAVLALERPSEPSPWLEPGHPVTLRILET